MSVAHSGGQGKTTLAQLLYLAGRKLGQSHSIVSTDFIDESGHSKIGKLYPDIVREMGVGASLTAARSENNPNAAIRYWDRIGQIFLDGGSIIDVGANVIPNLIEWSADRHLKKLMERKNSPRVDFFVVCKSERHSMDNVTSLIEEILQRDSFRIGRIFVVMNEVGGSFDEAALQKRVEEVAGEQFIGYLKMPKCQSEIWPAMEKNSVSIEQALAMEEDEAVDTLGVDLWTAASGLAELRTWVDFNIRTLRDAGAFQIDAPRLAKRVS